MTKQQLFTDIDKQYGQNAGDVTGLLTEKTILTLHTICCQASKPEQAGIYRNTPAPSCGPGHTPPEPSEIGHFMSHFMNQMITSRPMFHPVEFAAIAYKRLLDIYPFEAFNEETALLYMNLLLSKAGYPVISIPASCKTEYEASMALARTMPFPDTDPFVILIGKLIAKTSLSLT